MTDFTLYIKDNDRYYKVSRIYFFKDSSFAIDVPYHKDQRGYFIKLKTPKECFMGGKHVVPKENTLESFTSTKNAKLTFHKSGFVQFSGEGWLRSGLLNGLPKGLGIDTYSLENPIDDLIANIVCWGLDGFESTDKYPVARGKSAVLVFGSNNMVHEDYLIHQGDIPGFLFQFVYHAAKSLKDNDNLLPVRYPNGKVLPFNVMRNTDYGVLGVKCSPVRTKFFNIESGYSIQSSRTPFYTERGREYADQIMCIFPRPPKMLSGQEDSLDLIQH